MLKGQKSARFQSDVRFKVRYIKSCCCNNTTREYWQELIASVHVIISCDYVLYKDQIIILCVFISYK